MSFNLITKSCGRHFLKYMTCILVDWSGGWVTPWGSLDAPKTPRRNGNQLHVMVKNLLCIGRVRNMWRWNYLVN